MSDSEHTSEENKSDTVEETAKTYSLTKQAEESVKNYDVTTEIENHFRQGILAYAEGIRRYTLEIQKLKAQIDAEKKNIEKDEEVLLVLKREVGYDEKLLQKHNETFSLKINSLQELNSEYKDMLDEAEHTKIFKRKKDELQELQDEIDELEMTLLDAELEHINLLLKLEPKRNFIAELQGELKELELEKDHFESTKLHQIPLISQKQTLKGELVDTEVME